ncbi:MAG TPA: argininosuccinate lyase [Candidatus Thermoplasmatota archaeon]|jgi:argininosuccinate lyase|nr:argininosuccinate lyase [Candidatus Thermoplasmatota archaeon]
MPRKPWGGRFDKATSPRIEAFTSSLAEDARLLRFDVAGSIAHARMLGQVGLLTKAEAQRVEQGLREVLRGLEAGELRLDPALEDVHMNVEALLTKQIGDAGKRLHTARSRNDQVALDLRLLARERAVACADAALKLHATLVVLAAKHAADSMPGFTHLQRAQPITLGHHLLARAAQLERDVERFLAAFDAANRCPLGAGALAGSSLPIRREVPAKLLGFEGLVEHSMDAVSDRDFLIQGASAAAQCMVHASGFAEELVLWSTPEFGYLALDDSVATGSSLMPQKKNPDPLELVRGKAGIVQGMLMALLATASKLPLAYNRDLQETKAPFLRAMDTTDQSLRALEEVLARSAFDTEAMARALEDGATQATALAEHLVRAGVPFREAHEVVGRLVRAAQEQGIVLSALPKEQLAEAHPAFAEGAHRLLRHAAPPAKGSRGGPSSAEVRRLLAMAKAAQRTLAAQARQRKGKHAAVERLLGS